MIKLNEVYLDSSSQFHIREIFVNPRYIIRCIPDKKTKSLLVEGILNSLNLDKRVEFTNIIMEGNNSTIVVGAINDIQKKISSEKRLLLG